MLFGVSTLCLHFCYSPIGGRRRKVPPEAGSRQEGAWITQEVWPRLELAMKNLVWLLFLPGFLCNSNPLKINPDSLVTWEGSCVVIPCQINRYNGALLRDISLLWYFQPFYDTNRTEYSGHLLYNSSSTSRNGRTLLPSAFAGRLAFVGNVQNNLEKKTCSLKISQVQTEDSGIYGARLFATHSSGVRARWFLNATINVAESPPVPKMDISPGDIREGWMRVTCSVPYHCPEEPLRLTISGLGGTRLSSQRMTSNNGVIQTVVNLQMSWEDHGKSLICSLKKRNWSEISKSTMQLDVKYAPKDVRVIASPGTIMREGETLSLECRTKSSNPEVSEYLWYKDEQLMYDQPTVKRIAFETEGDKHSGAYRCGAKNSVGFLKSEELSIDVQYPPKEVKAERRPQGIIREGEKVELQCFSRGNPPISRYEWYKHPQTDVFRNSDRLRFNAVRFENAGTYYCVANNSLGQSESSPVTLDVLYAPKDVQLVIENEQLPIKEADTIRLNCSFSHSNPSSGISYYWYKDKSRLSNQGDLLIFPANLEKAGNYTCEVCNTVNCVPAQPVTVDIHYAPKGVKAVQELKTIREGNRVNLRCEVAKANPKVDSYRWYKDGVQQYLASAPAVLTIYHVTSSHSGTYWCEATNSVATSPSQEIRLNVYCE